MTRTKTRPALPEVPLKTRRSIYSLLTGHRRPAAEVKGMLFAMLGQPRPRESGYPLWQAIEAFIEAVAAGREGPPPAAA